MESLFAALLLLAQISGGQFTHVVQPGDSMASIGARYGVDARVLAEANGLKASDRLSDGRVLRIDNVHLVPPMTDADIVVNVPQRMLFFYDHTHAARGYPIAAGRAGWRTPLGAFTILSLEENPTWDVPVSIQEEMRRQGKPVLTRVPPSPRNPLGKYWIGLSLAGVGIHGTNAPTSIYKLVTHGCMRLHPDDIKDLFGRVDPEMIGRIIYEPVLLSQRDRSVFIEVHPDVYKKIPDVLERTEEMARAQGVFDMLDWTLVKEAISKRDGIARDVTRH